MRRIFKRYLFSAKGNFPESSLAKAPAARSLKWSTAFWKQDLSLYVQRECFCNFCLFNLIQKPDILKAEKSTGDWKKELSSMNSSKAQVDKIFYSLEGCCDQTQSSVQLSDYIGYSLYLINRLALLKADLLFLCFLHKVSFKYLLLISQ